MDLTQRLKASLGNSYELRRQLVGGGLSSVFVARDTALGRDIVIKVLSPELAGAVSNERFKREILIAAALQHPNIVPVHAAGEVDGLPYYTMPFVDGMSLRERLENRTNLPLLESISVLRDLARALAYAHERGIVHRDVKPENILLTNGIAVLTDLGIAKAISAAGDVKQSVTQTGVAVGTTLITASFASFCRERSILRAKVTICGK